jgi:tetratricopeptide (TPR) repeat protein
MQTIKNPFRKHSLFFLTALGAIFLWGCAPPGPRALLEGKRLLDEGQYAPAIEKLKLATSLLATNAQAWNYLGLAYHEAGQPANAVEAYQKALHWDHDLVIAHYNLGCLLLEQNKAESARTELTAFILHQGNSLDGWLKLGDAQLRLRELGAAEKSFTEALRLNSQNAEALNGLGVVQSQRNHSREAAQYFHAALRQQPDFGPALLNLAVTSQQSLNNRPLALQKYREYLALQPRPPNWESVNETARALEQELNPPARPVTNPPALAVNQNTNPVKPATNIARTPVTNSPKIELAAIQPKPAGPAPTPTRQSVQTEPPSTVEVVNVPEDLVIKPAQDISSARLRPATPLDKNPLPEPPASADADTTKTNKRGFFQRINPANLFRREPKAASPATPLPSTSTVTTPMPAESSEPAVAPPTVASTIAPVRAAAPPVQTWPRYKYKSPAKPAAGDRVRAQAFFNQGLQAQREGSVRDAVAAYRTAAQLDPAFFEAQANLGLAEHDLGEMEQSLAAYENALAIKPDSTRTRFSFALALRKAGCYLDAAQELERVLAANPEDASAHFALANLYAEQFHQPQAARQHYERVLAIDPRYPQATDIRFWLNENP